MKFHGGSQLLSAALLASLAQALDLKPITDLSSFTSGHSRRDGNTVFDPTSASTFFWGAYSDNNIYIANFTLFHPGDDEFILPLDNFAHKLKSVKCDNPMIIDFQDDDSFQYATSAWDWVNKNANHTFTLVTNENQCYQGDDRTPYTVTDIGFDKENKRASLKATEAQWDQVAQTFRLNIGHTQQDDAHPQLVRKLKDRDTQKTVPMSIKYDYNKNLFDFKKDAKETAGLALKCDAQAGTDGKILADIDVDVGLTGIKKFNMNIHPQGVNAHLMLALTADGKLGKELDFRGPNIDIPVEALKLGKIAELGPFVHLGINAGSTALEGTATASVGAKATIDDKATCLVDLKDSKNNKLDGWKPNFEKVNPEFSAEIKGGMKAWAELGITVKADILGGKWGYQASLDAQIPYFEADFKAEVNTLGVCNSKKTKGVDLSAKVGIDINVNAGETNKDPTFSKDLYNTNWPLFSTCMGIGSDDAHSSGMIATAIGRTTDKGSAHSKTGSVDAKPTESNKASATASGSNKASITASGSNKASASASESYKASASASGGNKASVTASGSNKASASASESYKASATASGSDKASATASKQTGSGKSDSSSASGTAVESSQSGKAPSTGKYSAQSSVFTGSATSASSLVTGAQSGVSSSASASVTGKTSSGSVSFTSTSNIYSGSVRLSVSSSSSQSTGITLISPSSSQSTGITLISPSSSQSASTTLVSSSSQAANVTLAGSSSSQSASTTLYTYYRRSL